MFNTRDPKNRYGSMVRALRALHDAKPARQYLAIGCLISCYLEAMAARGGRGTKIKYLKFLRSNFRQICAGLDGQEANMDGAEVFYKYFRSEMVHTYFDRNAKYAIAEDHELKGAYVGIVHVPHRSRPYIALNIDRLYHDFMALARKKSKQAGL